MSVELMDKVNTLSDKVNKKLGFRRFYPITETKRGELITVGLYDYTSKKYMIADMRHYSAENTLHKSIDLLLSFMRK